MYVKFGTCQAALSGLTMHRHVDTQDRTLQSLGRRAEEHGVTLCDSTLHRILWHCQKSTLISNDDSENKEREKVYYAPWHSHYRTVQIVRAVCVLTRHDRDTCRDTESDRGRIPLAYAM
jgi:hypothetical protein